MRTGFEKFLLNRLSGPVLSGDCLNPELGEKLNVTELRRNEVAELITVLEEIRGELPVRR